MDCMGGKSVEQDAENIMRAGMKWPMHDTADQEKAPDMKLTCGGFFISMTGRRS
jgi:hypothetical protein